VCFLEYVFNGFLLRCVSIFSEKPQKITMYREVDTFNSDEILSASNDTLQAEAFLPDLEVHVCELHRVGSTTLDDVLFPRLIC